MAIFKRFEIWLLLVLMVAAVWFAMRAGDPNEVEIIAEVDPEQLIESRENSASVTQTVEIPTAKESDPQPVDGGIRIEKVEVTQTKQGRVIDLTLLGRAKEGEMITLSGDSDDILVETDTGERVEPFFLPFSEPATLESGEESLAKLQYWLKDENANSLVVTVSDQTLHAEIPK